MTTITVFGGTGFLGRRLVQRLAAEGASVRVAVRHLDPARSALRTTGLNQITLFSADVRDQTSVAAAVAGADSVVNAVSAYVEKSGVTFEAVHERGAEMVAREAASAGVARLVLVSGIGADPKSGSPYIRARGRGESALVGVLEPSPTTDVVHKDLSRMADRLSWVNHAAAIVSGSRTSMRHIQRQGCRLISWPSLTGNP